MGHNYRIIYNILTLYTIYKLVRENVWHGIQFSRSHAAFSFITKMVKYPRTCVIQVSIYAGISNYTTFDIAVYNYLPTYSISVSCTEVIVSS